MKKRKKIFQNVFERIILRKRKLVKSKVDLLAVQRPHPDKKVTKIPCLLFLVASAMHIICRLSLSFT